MHRKKSKLNFCNLNLNIFFRERKLQEVQKHEQLPYHSNCVRFYQAWEERQRLYIQTELCCCRLVSIYYTKYVIQNPRSFILFKIKSLN